MLISSLKPGETPEVYADTDAESMAGTDTEEQTDNDGEYAEPEEESNRPVLRKVNYFEVHFTTIVANLLQVPYWHCPPFSLVVGHHSRKTTFLAAGYLPSLEPDNILNLKNNVFQCMLAGIDSFLSRSFNRLRESPLSPQMMANYLF